MTSKGMCKVCNIRPITSEIDAPEYHRLRLCDRCGFDRTVREDQAAAAEKPRARRLLIAATIEVSEKATASDVALMVETARAKLTDVTVYSPEDFAQDVYEALPSQAFGARVLVDATVKTAER